MIGIFAELNKSKEVLEWSQEVWGAMCCHEDEHRACACEHDFPAKVSLLDRDHNNDPLDIITLVGGTRSAVVLVDVRFVWLCLLGPPWGPHTYMAPRAASCVMIVRRLAPCHAMQRSSHATPGRFICLFGLYGQVSTQPASLNPKQPAQQRFALLWGRGAYDVYNALCCPSRTSRQLT